MMSKELDEKIEALEKEVAQLKRIKVLEGELAELKKETKQEGCQCQRHFWPWYQAFYPVYPQPYVQEWKPLKTTLGSSTITIKTGDYVSSGTAVLGNALIATNTAHSSGYVGSSDLVSRGVGVLVNKLFDQQK